MVVPTDSHARTFFVRGTQKGRFWHTNCAEIMTKISVFLFREESKTALLRAVFLKKEVYKWEQLERLIDYRMINLKL